MAVVEKIDEYGKGAWIALIVLGLWAFWPVGMAALAFVVFSGRGRAWKMERRGRWLNTGSSSTGWGRCRGTQSSGNASFDEYRTETIKRLEDEQKEFIEYLEKLRQAKDKSEFDQFMADRRGRSDLAT